MPILLRPALSRRAVLAGLGAAALAGRSRAAEAPVRIIFPYGAGGAGDAMARLLAEQLRISLDRPVVVENRAGAGGRIGVQAAVSAAPDGTTLLMAPAAVVTLQPHIYRNLAYDPLVGLLPVTQAVRFDQALVVGSQVPARSVAELMDWFRAHPDRAAFGSPGVGTVPHLVGFLLGQRAGIDLRHVPYRGTPAAMPDLLGGHLAAYLANLAEFTEHAKAGRVRILAIVGNARSAAMPEVPTLREQGFDAGAPGWFGFYVPARTAAETVARLNAAIVAALRVPEIRARLIAMGFDVTGTTPSELDTIQRAEYAAWAPIVRAANVTPED